VKLGSWESGLCCRSSSLIFGSRLLGLRSACCKNKVLGSEGSEGRS
jgi:hypothetical protein